MALSQRVVRTEDKRGERVSLSGRRETTTTMATVSTATDVNAIDGNGKWQTTDDSVEDGNDI